MRPGVAQGEICPPEEACLGKTFRQTCLQTVVVGVRNIPELVHETEGSVSIAWHCIEYTVERAQDERISIDEIRQLMGRAPNITAFHNEVPTKFALQAQVVLIDVRCPECRLNEKDPTSRERQKSRCIEIDI